MQRFNDLDEFITRTVPRRVDFRPSASLLADPSKPRARPLIHERDPPRHGEYVPGSELASHLEYRPGLDRAPLGDGRTFCVNHGQKAGDYEIVMEDGEVRFFCEKCAAKLATQGFNVRERSIKASARSKGRGQLRRRQLPHFPEFEGDPMYEEIMETLRKMAKTDEDYCAMIERVEGLDEHYARQVELTSGCYDELLALVRDMKRDHLADIEAERERLTQTGAIWVEHLEDGLAEMEEYRSDIEGNFRLMMEDIRQSAQSYEGYRVCMDNYHHKLELLANQLEQENRTFAKMVDYNAASLQDMPAALQVFLTELWEAALKPVVRPPLVPIPAERVPNANLPERPPPNPATNPVKALHQVLPKASSEEHGKKAFRSLAAEEEVLLDKKISPNFKEF